MTISEKRRWPLRAMHDMKPIMDVLLQRSRETRARSVYVGRQMPIFVSQLRSRDIYDKRCKTSGHKAT